MSFTPPPFQHNIGGPWTGGRGQDTRLNFTNPGEAEEVSECPGLQRQPPPHTGGWHLPHCGPKNVQKSAVSGLLGPVAPECLGQNLQQLQTREGGKTGTPPPTALGLTSKFSLISTGDLSTYRNDRSESIRGTDSWVGPKQYSQLGSQRKMTTRSNSGPRPVCGVLSYSPA